MTDVVDNVDLAYLDIMNVITCSSSYEYIFVCYRHIYSIFIEMSYIILLIM